MSLSRRKRTVPRLCIDLNQPHAVRHWCERLRCTRQELVQAARCVGDSARAIQVFLRA